MLAIVLSRHDFREFDQMISLYTKESGKREAMARGIKKSTAKNAAALEVGNVVEIELIPGKEVDHIGTVQLVALFSSVRSSLTKIVIACYALIFFERVVKMHVEDYGLFIFLLDFLEMLEKSSVVSGRTLIAFYVRLLGHLGFAAEFDRCVRGGEAFLAGSPPKYFSIQEGGLVCGPHQATSISAQNESVPITALLDVYLKKFQSAPFAEVESTTITTAEIKQIIRIISLFGAYHGGIEEPNWNVVDKMLADN